MSLQSDSEESARNSLDRYSKYFYGGPIYLLFSTFYEQCLVHSYRRAFPLNIRHFFREKIISSKCFCFFPPNIGMLKPMPTGQRSLKKKFEFQRYPPICFRMGHVNIYIFPHFWKSLKKTNLRPDSESLTDFYHQNQRLRHEFRTACARSGLRPTLGWRLPHHGRCHVAGAVQAYL